MVVVMFISSRFVLSLLQMIGGHLLPVQLLQFLLVLSITLFDRLVINIIESNKLATNRQFGNVTEKVLL